MKSINFAWMRVIGLALIILTLFSDVFSTLWAILSMLNRPDHAGRWWRIVKAKDQVFNASTGGSEDETLSSRSARARDRGERWGCILCKLLDRIDPNHCDRARGQ